jgi:hypothetical protein
VWRGQPSSGSRNAGQRVAQPVLVLKGSQPIAKGLAKADIDGALKKIRVPTEAEITAAVRRRYDRVKATNIENWPAELLALSIRQVGMVMTAEQHIGLMGAVWGRSDGEFNLGDVDPSLTVEMIRASLTSLEAWVDEQLKEFPQGAFIGLGSRSPKDSWAGMRDGFMRGGFKVTSGKYGVELLVDSTERISDDLSVAEHVAEGVPGIDIGAIVTARRATELRPEIFDGPRYLTARDI